MYKMIQVLVKGQVKIVKYKVAWFHEAILGGK